MNLNVLKRKTLCVLAVMVFLSILSPFNRGLVSAEVLLLLDETKEVLFCRPIKEGDIIIFDFVNSIYKASVKETMLFDSVEGLILIDVESPSYGVYEYYGLITEGKNKGGFRRKIGSLRIRSNNYQHHRLSVNGMTIDLKDLASGGMALILTIDKNHICD
ncbi:MAG: hypothetical protein N2745_10790 [Syntrophorhabdaceae bacterium]|nr:hypothetical protein [Syntrophorhabdaceae bacterium]